ncbi:cyclic pyranopterin monophosphate synthase MoaC [Oscillatoria laete-virens NRMC-F 0139]|nr:cyclic pyranopterin monophosphate synthase MoaC [Oscillatoria laete-virens NRMC-F 0139]
MKKLTHVSEAGMVQMVDVGHKPVIRREAVAEGSILLQPETLTLIRKNRIAKGNVLTTAQIAGIQAAKRTAELIPLCHGINVSAVSVDFGILPGKGIHICATAQIAAQTGVEMEALTAVSVAALTIYDMCKAVDKKMKITGVRLVSKRKYEH